LFQGLSVLLELVGVLVFKGKYFVLILLLRVFELLVPVFIELLVLFDVGLFTLFTLLLVHEDHLLHLTGVLLFFQLDDSVFSHFSFNVAALLLTGMPVLLHSGTVHKLVWAKVWLTYINSSMFSALISLY
jgi:hypothetical protein